MGSSHRSIARSTVALAGALAVVAAGCSRTADHSQSEYGSTGQAVWVNGDFESDTAGTTPPTGFTLSTYSNGGVTGSVSAPPLTESALNLSGSSRVKTYVVGGTTGSQIDPDLGSGQTFRFPRFGVRAAVVNYQNATNNGSNQNVNAIRQTMTVTTGDLDPVDDQVHVRFAVAPVLENPSHAYTEQPYYFVSLDNLTTGKNLYADFNIAGQPGVPWKTTTSIVTGNPTLWTDWQLVDVPGAAGVAIGDQVKLTIVGAGCSLGAHFGRIYVDGLSSTVPGLYTWATGPAFWPAGSDLTYTLNYRNGGTSASLASTLDFTTPPNTTFVSTTGPSCTTPVVGSGGVTSCLLGTLQPGATGSFTVTVHVPSTSTGALVMGNYEVHAVNASPLIGSKVVTQLIAAGSKIADIQVTNSDQRTQAEWGDALTYTVTVKNTGALLATGVQVTDTLPAELTNASWSCVTSDPSARCTASGTGSISDTIILPAGATATYTLQATVISGSGTGVVKQLASASTAAGTTDPYPSNNSALDLDQIGPAKTLTVTKTGGAAAGAVMVSPSGTAGCGTDCTTSTGTYASGTPVVLSIAPAAGYSFTGWSGDCSSAGLATNCTVTLDQNRSVGAAFSAPWPRSRLGWRLS